MLRIFVFTIILTIVFFVAEQYFVAPWIHPRWKMLLIFFFSISFLTQRLIENGLQGNQERLLPLYLAALVSRLVLGLAFVGFFLFQHIDHRRAFALDFLVLYIFYTGFEIWDLTRNLRRDS
ncbi:hypothetical protein BH09BAC4_BH09BAC4_17380 [soil metagenome]